jgi:nucleotide-binding universal stress UspA family protein
MYKRILLASDGSKESLIALREGALIARAFRTEAHLLIIERETPGLRVADSVYPTVRSEGSEMLLQKGLARLRRLGVRVTGEVVAGEPAPIIAAAARRFEADLVVVGHRRQTLLERWWSGVSGAYLVDNVSCSVLVARDVITDEEFEAALEAEPERA